MIAGIVKAFTDAAEEWLKIGINIVQGIINGIKEGAKGLFESIQELAENALQAAKDALGIESPSKEGAYLGKMFDYGIAKGVTDNLGVIDSAMDEASARTLDGFKVAANASYETTSNTDRIDLLIAMLGEYLPVIAENRGITEEQIYQNINRQLGWGIS